MAGHVFDQACGVAEAEHQQAARHGVERPRVTDFALVGDPARFRDDIVARPARFLVHQENAVESAHQCGRHRVIGGRRQRGPSLAAERTAHLVDQRGKARPAFDRGVEFEDEFGHVAHCKPMHEFAVEEVRRMFEPFEHSGTLSTPRPDAIHTPSRGEGRARPALQ